MTAVYRKTERQLPLENFYLPFSGELNPENRWVKLSKIIPWDVIEEKYASLFAKSGKGAPAKPVRMALGALIIKETLVLSDEELVNQLTENPYLQYFIGLPEFQKEAPFDPSMMVHFRKRLNGQVMQEINELICLEKKSDDRDPDDKNAPGGGSGKKNKGRLIIDATCAPADIRYPTDRSLLNEAREKLEMTIDTLYEPFKGQMVKPRTYRRNARKDYLYQAKAKKHHKKALRKAVGKQLRYVARDIRIVKDLLNMDGHGTLSQKQEREFQTIQKLYEQQQAMYDKKTNQIEDRIVSISQPHIRPIVRGKARAQTEFGAKIIVRSKEFLPLKLFSLVFSTKAKPSTRLDSIERYRKRHGHYPKVACADRIFRNRKNLEFCKQNGIRLSGPRLGRPNIKKLKKFCGQLGLFQETPN